MTKPSQLDREIAEFLAEAPLAGTHDVTAKLLSDSAYGPGPQTQLVADAKAATSLTPTLEVALTNLRNRVDRSIGFVSKALAYSKGMPSSKREHANLIRLIKGGFVHVCEVRSAPPAGSFAKRDSPYGDRYYVLHIGPCGSEL
jgi:hypothetical protein